MEKSDTGDTFTVETKEGIFQPGDEPMKTWGEPVELEIVGMFHPNFKQENSDYTAEESYMENIIYADMDTHARLQKNLNKKTADEEYTRVDFLVEDSQKLDSIMKQIKESKKIDLNNIMISVDNTAYQSAAKPYDQIRTFSVILLALGIGGIGSILFLVLQLWVQGRKHEAGVLLSVGVGKGKIFCQMLAECLMVSLIALVLSFSASEALIDKCADIMESVLAPEAGTEAYEVMEIRYGEPVIMKTSADEVVLNHEVSGETLLFAILFVCGTSGISVYLSFMKIGSLEPKKLLRSM